MQQIRDILIALKEINAAIFLEGDQLRIDAEKGVIGESLRALIRVHKQELVDYIRDVRKDDFHRIDPAAPQTSYVLSSAQKSLWLLSQQEEASIAYNIPGM